MYKSVAIVVLGIASISSSGLAADEYPQSTELQAAQAELDALRAGRSRESLNAEEKKQLDAAISRRNVELDKRNTAWRASDSGSMLKAQTEACTALRSGLREGKTAIDYFDSLRYAGLSSDETLDVVLQIKSNVPEIGKSVRVAFCILGLPTDTIRSKSKNSDTTMLVYPKMFVHIEDGKVTAWSDR